jgi:hypothetical protein
VNWVCVSIVSNHEIENAVIAFKSTGSRIWKKWKEDAKTRSDTSAVLVYDIFEGAYSNANYEWTDFDFKYRANLLETDKKEALYCLKKSNAIRESYEKATFVANHDIASLKSAKTSVPQIEDVSETEETTDDEEYGF